jgi:hypothetical protein
MKKLNQLETEKSELKQVIENMNETLNNLLRIVKLKGVYILLPFRWSKMIEKFS